MHDLFTQPQSAVPAIELDKLTELRRRAAARLSREATHLGSIAGAADALAVLHALASSPDTATDALALLHELQVYQVELDLQALELRESRIELESALRRQRELYDCQPAGSLTIDAQLVLHELNLTAAVMLGVDPADAIGLGLDAFLDADSLRRIKGAVSCVQQDRPRVMSHLSLHRGGVRQTQLLASIATDPSGDRYLLSLLDAGDEPVR